MKRISRRQLIRGCVVATSGSLISPRQLEAFSFGEPLAFQLHSLRFLASRDFPGTLRRMAELGYKVVELVSFKGYSANTARDGFAALAPLSPAEIGRIIHEAGLITEAAHFKFEEFTDERIGRSMEWAHGVGLKRMTISDIARAEATPIATMDAWLRAFERINRTGELVQRGGLLLGHHTEFDTWKEIDGQIVMDAMLRQVDPKNCQFQLDMATTISRGIDAADYLLKYPGRFFSLHLRDGRRPAEPGAYVNALPLGRGEVAWKKVLTAAQKAKVSNYVVEMAVPAAEDPVAAYKISAEFLRTLSI